MKKEKTNIRKIWYEGYSHIYAKLYVYIHAEEFLK